MTQRDEMPASRVRRASRISGFARVLVISHVLVAVGWWAPGEGLAAKPACVTVKKRVVNNGARHNHLVTLINGCKFNVKCKVTTNANPEGVVAVVAAGKSVTVNTFLGSPAREFQAQTHCVKQ